MLLLRSVILSSLKKDLSINSPSLIMKFTAILLATLSEASKATFVDHTDGGGVSQDFAVSDVNKPGLASVVDAVVGDLNNFDNLLAHNGNQGHCQPWGNQGGDLCREEKKLAVCSGYDEKYYLPYNSQAEVASKCLEETKCKGYTWDTSRARGKLKSIITSVDNSNTRWQCFKKQEGYCAASLGSDSLLSPIVNCKNGMAFDCANPPVSLGTTCYEECNNGTDCCWGSRACAEFTGKVAKDGSCMSEKACFQAGRKGVVGLISGASCVGHQACFATGHEGSVGDISVASCLGTNACMIAGSNGGSVGLISGASCVGEKACYATGSESGSVGDISLASCLGTNACNLLGSHGNVGVGDLSGCCTTPDKCYGGLPDDACPSDGKGITSEEAQVVSLLSINKMG